MNNVTGKVIILVSLAILIVVACVVFLLPSGDNPEGHADYDGKEGIITLTFAEPIPYAEWTADVYFESSDTASRTYVVEDAPVTLSPDRMTAKISDPSLINLDNNTYDVEVSAPSQTVHRISFQVTDHSFTGDEITLLVIVALIFIIAIGFLLARRFIFGGKMSWSWSKKLN